MKVIENTQQFNELVEGTKPVLLDFYADWCGPCQALLPTVEKLAAEYADTVEIQKVNVDQNQELAAHFKVKSIPALFFIKDGKVVDTLNGLAQESVLRQKLDAL